MPLGEEDAIMKPLGAGGGSVAGNGTVRSSGYRMSNGQSYRNYGQSTLIDEGNFSIEESMYAINGQTRINSQ